MTALSTSTLQAMESSQGFESFIKEEVTLISSLNDARIQQMMDYSKNFLDKVFPLSKGSHKDVRNYVVYYQHLLAFFEDGSQAGLKQPKQFVALSGHKENPTSIVLKNADGFHVEVIFNAHGKRGSRDKANVDDIQIETKSMDLGDVTIAANDEQTDSHWFSMVRGDSEITTNRAGQRICRCVDQRKHFTGKDGEEYRIG
ncbi:malate synthase [Reinekea sp. G2M2-21]|uniref:malate synthase n=1 Tax=Reinekea sp. G2M2-21 TaxID=2788942 RepID=UPI001E3A1F2C|nr:malate synthase [Reinekea sp. G2M2-21]